MLEAFQNNFDKVLIMTGPMLFISAILLISIRVAYLFNNKEKFDIFNEFMLLSFALYILCLFQIVTAQDINITTGNNLIPFREIGRYTFGTPLFMKNIIGNVLMFAPYGFFLAYYTNIKKPFKIWLLIFIASLAIESTQLVIGRIFDVDDIILNFIGGTLGYLFFLGLDRLFHSISFISKNKWVKNAIAVVIMCMCLTLIIWRLK